MLIIGDAAVRVKPEKGEIRDREIGNPRKK